MNKITALHSGTYYNLVSLFKEPFAKYFHKCVYLPELKKSDLDDCDILLVTDSLVAYFKSRTLLCVSWGECSCLFAGV